MNESRKQFEEWWQQKVERLNFEGVGRIHQERLRARYMESWIDSWQSSRKALQDNQKGE